MGSYEEDKYGKHQKPEPKVQFILMCFLCIRFFQGVLNGVLLRHRTQPETHVTIETILLNLRLENNSYRIGLRLFCHHSHTASGLIT